MFVVLSFVLLITHKCAVEFSRRNMKCDIMTDLTAEADLRSQLSFINRLKKFEKM